MKAVFITAYFMSLYLGVSHTLQASSEIDRRLVVESVVEVEQLIELFVTDNQSTSNQLKQELSQSLESLTHAIRNSATAIVDVVLSAVSYVFLLLGQAFASIVLDR